MTQFTSCEAAAVSRATALSQPARNNRETAARCRFAAPFHQLSARIAGIFLACAVLLALIATPAARAQDLSTGALNVTVLDPSGAAVNGAQLVLKDLGTNDIHNGKTSGTGSAVLSYLAPATYSLTVTHEGFGSKVYPSVTIQANQVTDIKVTLQVGAATQSISVSGEASPLLDTTSSTLSTTLDLKQIEDLPIGGRDVTDLAFLVAGAVGNNFNNLPGGAVNMSSNGFSTMPNRNKSAGFDDDSSSISNRLEDVQEMTVQTGELDASKGGTSAMDIGFVTRRGTNRYHGRLYEDYRSRALNANSWYNNYVGQPRSAEIINDFGGSVGGPIWKNKLFFFASLSNFRQPYSWTVSTWVPTAQVLNGIYTYAQGKTVNVLQAGASSPGCTNCSSTVNSVIAGDLKNIESTYDLPGVTMTDNVDLNHDQVNFQNHEMIIQKYPTLRLDYNLSQNFRWTGSVNESNNYYIGAGAPPYPGPLYANQQYSSVTRNYQVVTGFDWDARPNLVNAFRVGYLYTGFTYNSQGIDAPTQEMIEQGDLAWGLSLTSGVNGFNSLKGGSLYPVLSVKDDTTWAHGNHTIMFGVESATEIDHYYNNQFVPYIGVNSIATGDPAATGLQASVPADAPASAVGDVEGLYATLTGRMTYYSLGEFVNYKTRQFQQGVSFNLHERLNQTALFVQDSWRATPELTLNLGLRWDLTGASEDETGFYTHPDVANLWGPSGVGNIFKPGTLTGVMNPVEGPASKAYAATYVHPEPSIGVAWNPRQPADTFLGKLFGQGKSVVRVSYTFKNYTEGAQNFWNFGSNGGANFNTYYYADPVAPQAGVTPAAGFYNAGSVTLGGPLPALASTSPSPYQSTIPFSYQAFSDTSYYTFDPHIQQPWVESWQFGIQRELSPNNVLEVRYVGNVSRKQWLGVNYNEVNIFENGFLSDFKNAQANLAASNGTTFKGAQPTPILDQAFASSGSSNYTNGTFITYLQQGQAGAFASALAGNSTYLCSLVTSFSGCNTVGLQGTGTEPINFFQANPFAAGAQIVEMENAGYSNYNALQIDFRQRPSHGMQFDANYTYSHSLGNSIQGSTAPGVYGGGGNNNAGNSAPSYYTLRNTRLNYFPSAYDIRHVLHISGTYDLPFGRGREFLNQSKIANATIGGWTVGMILTYQGGNPYLFYGGNYVNGALVPQETFNQNDGGITLNGVTQSQLQHQIRVRHVPGKPYVSFFDPKYTDSSTGEANTSYISPNFNAGTIGTLMWLHAPKWINTDLSINKTIPIFREYNLKLEGVFLNAFNHAEWTGMNTYAQSTTFGTTSTTVNGPRNIELRANFQF